MRQGFNPHKDQPQEKSEFIHQIIIPVFIPHQHDYFKDSFKILKLCLESLFATIHAKTFITIVNNSKRWKDPVVTTLEPLGIFYPAEEYHQDYLRKNVGGYTCHAIYFDSYLK